LKKDNDHDADESKTNGHAGLLKSGTCRKAKAQDTRRD